LGASYVYDQARVASWRMTDVFQNTDAPFRPPVSVLIFIAMISTLMVLSATPRISLLIRTVMVLLLDIMALYCLIVIVFDLRI
jgi:hypothetical protein